MTAHEFCRRGWRLTSVSAPSFWCGSTSSWYPAAHGRDALSRTCTRRTEIRTCSTLMPGAACDDKQQRVKSGDKPVTKMLNNFKTNKCVILQRKLFPNQQADVSLPAPSYLHLLRFSSQRLLIDPQLFGHLGTRLASQDVLQLHVELLLFLYQRSVINK